MNLTLKDLRVETPAFAESQRTTAGVHNRPASLADLIEALKEQGAEEVMVTDSAKHDWIDPVIRLVPNTLEYGDRYLILRLETPHDRP